MPLRESKGPALKPTGPLDKMSFSIGIYCQAVSHDDTLKDSTHDSSSVMAASHWHGQHPEHKYHGLAEMDSHALPYGTHSVKKVNQVSVVKAAAPLLCIFWSQCRSRGAFHVLSKKKAGLRSAGDTSHKVPPTEEIKYIALSGRSMPHSEATW